MAKFMDVHNGLPALAVRRMVLAALIRLLPQRLRMHQVVTPGTAVPPPCGHRQMDLSAPDRPWPGGRAATAIRPAHRADLAALRDFFAGLSAHTRYLRFFGPVTPSSALLQELCGLADTIDAVIAVRGGVIVGHAMAADRTDPRGTRVTDIGVVVADAWQGRGLGSALMRALVTRAQARGATFAGDGRTGRQPSSARHDHEPLAGGPHRTFPRQREHPYPAAAVQTATTGNAIRRPPGSGSRLGRSEEAHLREGMHHAHRR